MICLLCNKEFKNTISLSNHIIQTHKIKIKSYYDQYLKNNQIGICLSCKGITKFTGIISGYNKFCNNRCKSNYEVGIPKKLNKKYDKMSCQICHKEYNGSMGISSHIVQIHKISVKEYYDKFVRKPSEGFCKKCGNPTRYHGGFNGYSINCSIKCARKHTSTYKPTREYILCQICDKKFHGYEGIVAHCRRSHNISSKEYYDKYIKKENDGICLECKKSTKFTDLGHGYNEFCSNTCANTSKIVQERKKITSNIHYNKNNFSQTTKGRYISRTTAFNMVKIQYLNNEPTTPRIGTNERVCLNELQNYILYRIERNSQIIGYFPDGYINELNLIIEFDESHHYVNGQLHPKDIQREHDLKQELNCDFFRIKEKDWLNNKELIIENFKKFLK
jgi:very-short-patch-repair endonuclease